MSLEQSMQDLDSAVGRLDNILMTVYFFVVVIFIAVALVRQFIGPVIRQIVMLALRIHKLRRC
jgi:hypothetical protein